MKLLLALILILFVSFSFGKHYESSRWVRKIQSERIPNHASMTFNVYLKQQNAEVLEDTIKLISDPKSSQYGNYLSVNDITNIVAPSHETIKTVENWIKPHRPLKMEYGPNKDVVKVTMKKSSVEKLMNVKIDSYTHPNGKSILRSSEDPILNSKLKNHIDLITGISNFPMYKKDRSLKSFDENDYDLMTSSSSSSSDGFSDTGLRIISIKGTGEYMKVTYQPSCSPTCNNKYYPVTITTTTLNQVVNNSIVSEDIMPTCSIQNNLPVCIVNANSYLYQPQQVSILDTITRDTNVWPFNFVSTPIVVPQTIKDYYGIPNNYIVSNPNATQCVVEFEQQYYSPQDLTTFFNSMGLVNNATVNLIGYNDVSNPGVEASLDIQYMMGVAPGAETTFWSIYTNSSAEIDDILQWAIAIAGTENPPLVNSLSYGMTEFNVDKYLGNGYMARSEIEFQKVALRGITIVIASGDSGAGDLGGEPMSTDNCNTLHADWPSNSPYVTSVGSIYFTPYAVPICYEPTSAGGVNCQSNTIGEVGVSLDYGMLWSSGGGFSNFTTTAFYQEDFVSSYIEKLNELNVVPPSNIWNSKGRAYPDFSSVGHNLYVINGGEWLSVDGTSASAPIFAGMITILNDIRLNAGLPALGFINPLFYQIYREHPEAFYDVVVGNNRCGLSDFKPFCCDSGYTAVSGFDTVSGLGRPNMEVLMKLILNY
ncbi:hypothetical protein DICPUDRAFT_152956 [Dictyostelium purpureum]|uniref:Peptidase S53 domain-containing protein n=1 Tax=Dictyostelium purpureum TaxID=5786 RepID=F0ZMP8_DICPU|nr:uncharacterized protein DICPUDRAFT_152956 [Dictyostelium purpureum]EGC34780.1 hypothetical protein DICPUDRAFT_152956 [Dictyostelium purpureum]|eukprot:XP_003288695.1 hypothetical protein DICPUDRAFT_152956 [Dictyostelium purpureum]